MHYSNYRDDFAEKTHRLQNFFDGDQIAPSSEIIITNTCGVAQSIIDEIEALGLPEDESCETVQLSDPFFEAADQPEPYVPQAEEQAEEPASKGEGVVKDTPLSLPLPTPTITPNASTDDDHEYRAWLAAMFEDLDKPNTSPPEPIVRPPSLREILRKDAEDREARKREADEQRAEQRNPIKRQWQSLTPEKRILSVIRLAAQRGGLAMSLDFSKANEARYRKSDDPARALSRSLNRALKKRFGYALDYFFTFEFCPLTDKLHAHGVIIPGAHDPKEIRAALYSTTGKAESKYAQGRMVDLKKITDSTGWHWYCLKGFAKASERLTGKPFFITENFRRGAEAWHDSKKATAARPRVSKPSPANDNAKAEPAPVARYESKEATASQAQAKPTITTPAFPRARPAIRRGWLPYGATCAPGPKHRPTWRGTG